MRGGDVRACPPSPVTDDPALRRAYATCLGLARAHYENFPVASRLLPAAIRPHVAAVYAFARVADDFADEGDRPAGARIDLLNRWDDRLQRAAGAPPPARSGADGRPANGRDDRAGVEHPDARDIFLALADTIRRYDLPVGLFRDLLSAFRQDVTVTRYATWADLLDYCRRSANPVGRLVLRLSGYRDAALDRRSDAICSALQITNFLQDFGRDWRAGRLYVPADIQAECGTRVADLEAGRITPAWRAAIGQSAGRTQDLFLDGRPVCDAVRGRLRLELRLTWLGGMRILERVARTGYDPFTNRPALGAADALPLIWRALVWT